MQFLTRKPAREIGLAREHSYWTRVRRMDEAEHSEAILVVEDDPDLRLVHSEILGQEGYSVMTAADGVEALQIVERTAPPAMILLDLGMPRMDGWELVRRIRKRPGWSDVPIVVVAAHYRIADEAAMIGARAWLHKPVGIDDLLRVVARIHAERRIGRSRGMPRSDSPG